MKISGRSRGGVYEQGENGVTAGVAGRAKGKFAAVLRLMRVAQLLIVRAPAGMQRLRRTVHSHAEGVAAVGQGVSEHRGAAMRAGGIS